MRFVQCVRCGTVDDAVTHSAHGLTWPVQASVASTS